MKRVALASLFITVGLGSGCGGGAAEQKPVASTPAAKEAEPPPAPQDPAAPILAAMHGFKDEVCACQSQPCVDGVDRRMMEWAMAHMEEMKELEPTKEQDQESDRIQAAMDACRERISPASSSNVALTPLPAGGTGSPACDEYLRTFDAVIVTCREQLGPALDAMLQARNAQADAFAQWATLDAASKKATVEAAESGCKSATDAVRQSASSMGCPL